MRLSSIPGVLAAVVVMFAGFQAADVLGQALLAAQGLTGSSPISGVPVAILLGLLLRNALPLPSLLAPGLKFSVSTILRLGIVLVGIRLSVFDVARLGVAGLPVVIGAIVTGLVFVTWFNNRLGLPPRLGTLIAAGTSICGVTAIVSTAPAIEADEREVAYAVANVVAFGLFGMLAYPYLAHALLARSETIGLFLGTAVHDTSQVVGSALTYKQLYADDVVLRVATVTKLTRNLFLAAVIPLLTWMHLRNASLPPHPNPLPLPGGEGAWGRGGLGERGPRGEGARGRGDSQARSVSAKRISFGSLVPTFVIGFVAMAIVRSIGDATLTSTGSAYGIWSAADWARLTNMVGDTWASRFLLGTAMAAVGLNTNLSVFRGVGLKPFVVGMAGAAAVGGVGLLLALVFGRYVSL